jgi:hypothetical protein
MEIIAQKAVGLYQDSSSANDQCILLKRIHICKYTAITGLTCSPFVKKLNRRSVCIMLGQPGIDKGICSFQF